MNLFEIFNVEPLPEIVVEYPPKSGIYNIPIEEIKKMLWHDFDWWGTSHFQYTITLIGHRVLVSGSVQLNLCFKGVLYTFVGACTFYEGESPNGEVNDNLTATALSFFIKNAVLNLGRKYGMFLNTKRIANRIPPPEKPNMQDSVKSILRDT